MCLNVTSRLFGLASYVDFAYFSAEIFLGLVFLGLLCCCYGFTYFSAEIFHSICAIFSENFRRFPAAAFKICLNFF